MKNEITKLTKNQKIERLGEYIEALQDTDTDLYRRLNEIYDYLGIKRDSSARLVKSRSKNAP